MSKIFGIVNITTDSFSDGGLYLDSKKAIEHALKLAEDGADIIDLGAASSNPDTTDVSVEEEIKRLKPVIKALKKQNIKKKQIIKINQVILDMLSDKDFKSSLNSVYTEI